MKCEFFLSGRKLGTRLELELVLFSQIGQCLKNLVSTSSTHLSQLRGCLPRDVRVGPKFGQIGPKWDISGTR